MGGMVDVGEVAARDVEVLAVHLGEFMKPYLEVVGWATPSTADPRCSVIVSPSEQSDT